MQRYAKIATFLLVSIFLFSGFIKLNDPIGTQLKLEEYFDVFSVDFPWMSGFWKFWIPYALIQKTLENSDQMEFSPEELGGIYDDQVEITLELLRNKNHDYGEAWRDMRVSSMTDLILMKIFRTKQIENNLGVTLVSEGVEANYQDMLNYAVFCLIKLKEEQSQQAQQ